LPLSVAAVSVHDGAHLLRNLLALLGDLADENGVAHRPYLLQHLLQLLRLSFQYSDVSLLLLAEPRLIVFQAVDDLLEGVAEIVAPLDVLGVVSVDELTNLSVNLDFVVLLKSFW
jgi:hypothetical protein